MSDVCVWGKKRITNIFLVTKIIHSNNLIDMGFNIVAYQNKVNIVTQLAKRYNDIFGVYHTFMYHIYM